MHKFIFMFWGLPVFWSKLTLLSLIIVLFWISWEHISDYDERHGLVGFMLQKPTVVWCTWCDFVVVENFVHLWDSETAQGASKPTVKFPMKKSSKLVVKQLKKKGDWFFHANSYYYFVIFVFCICLSFGLSVFVCVVWLKVRFSRFHLQVRTRKSLKNPQGKLRLSRWWSEMEDADSELAICVLPSLSCLNFAEHSSFVWPTMLIQYSYTNNDRFVLLFTKKEVKCF